MKRTKIASLLFAAIVAVAFAAPAGASATEWTHNGDPFFTNDYIEAEGQFGLYMSAGTSFSCEAYIATLVSGNSDDGELVDFLLGNCSTNGAFVGCKIELKETNLPAPLRATESGAIEISDFTFALRVTGSDCGPWGNIYAGTWKFDDVAGYTLEPDDSSAMSIWAAPIGSFGAADVQTPYGHPTLFGLNANMDVIPAGEYGIQQ